MQRCRLPFQLALLFGVGTVTTLFFDDLPKEVPDAYPIGVLLEDGATYDYIVVGAGAAGTTAAARLALKGFSVVLIEAGGDPDFISTIPMASLSLLGSPLDWQYKTIPNNVSCLSSVGDQCRFSRGKCLGGSTTINHMLYVRGNRCDYDRMNISGWKWKDLKPYFLRSEGLQILDKYPSSSRKYHNTTGPLKLEYFDNPQNAWFDRIKEGMEQLNVPYNKDLNGKYQIGVSQIAGYVYKGQRMSTARAFLTRDDVKKALTVAKNAFCTELVMDDDNVAEGVNVIQGLKKVTIYARREVILSAGAIGTPPILMRSGIGPRRHLEQMGIPVRINLPVGKNMMDHQIPLIIVKVDQGGVISTLLELGSKAPQVVQYLATKTGPLASNSLQDMVTLLSTDHYDFKRRRYSDDSTLCQVADMQLIQAYIDKGLVTLGKALVKQGTGFKDQVLDQIEKANRDHGLIIFSPIVLLPYSRGYVRLASTEPLDPPAIFANYLGDERDVTQMVKFLTIMEHLVDTPVFKENNASILYLDLPDCPSYSKSKKNYWSCYSRHMTYSPYHAVGTSAITKVVDEKLRVYGAKKLRVADLGVLKNMVGGNTASPAIAIGERVVDFLIDKVNKY